MQLTDTSQKSKIVTLKLKPGAHTDKNQTASLDTQIFGVGELLEQVLRHLDLKTLISAEIDCKEWRDFILRIKMLQDVKKSSFAKPATFKEAVALGMVGDEDYVVVSEDDKPAIAVLNRGLAEFVGNEDKSSEVEYPYVKMKLTSEVFPFTSSAKPRRGDWEHMYLSQPPPRSASFKFPFAECLRKGYNELVANVQSNTAVDDDRWHDVEGLTVGEIMDEQEKPWADTVSIQWWRSEIFIPGRAMRYSDTLPSMRTRALSVEMALSMALSTEMALSTVLALLTREALTMRKSNSSK